MGLEIALLGRHLMTPHYWAFIWLFLSVSSQVVEQIVPSLQLLAAVVLRADEGLRPLVTLGIQVLDEQKVLGRRDVQFPIEPGAVKIFSLLDDDV